MPPISVRDGPLHQQGEACRDPPQSAQDSSGAQFHAAGWPPKDAAGLVRVFLLPVAVWLRAVMQQYYRGYHVAIARLRTWQYRYQIAYDYYLLSLMRF